MTCLSVSVGVQTTLHLRPLTGNCIHLRLVELRLIHLRPHSCETRLFETTFIWDLLVCDSGVASPKFFGGPKCLILDEQQYFVWDTASQSTKWLHMLTIWEAWALGPPSLHLWFATCSFETIVIWDRIHLGLVELRPVHLRLHSCGTRFLLWLLRTTHKDIFSFLVFHFLVKSWNYYGNSIKETGRNILVSLGLTKWRFRGAMLPSEPEIWRVFWPLRGFKVRVHLQYNLARVTLDTETRNLTLQTKSHLAKLLGLPQRSWG